MLVVAGCGDAEPPAQVAETRDGVTRGPAAMVFDLGWRVDKHIRLARDVDGDHRTDLVGFGPFGVAIALAQGNSFSDAFLEVGNLGSNNGWDLSNSVRTLADVNGDGQLDAIGIGPDSVQVSLGLGGGGFFPVTGSWSVDYTAAAGWNPVRHALMLGDVNGDGKADLVGINDWGVYVSLSNGSSFAPAQLWLRGFSATAGGWDATKHVRMLADVNNDGFADIIGIGQAGVFVSLSDGKRFGAPVQVLSEFGVDRGWLVGSHIRQLANLNGDAYPDLIGMGPNGTVVALGTGKSSVFAPPTTWSTDFGDATHWDASKDVRLIGDVDGDGRDDVVGINDNQVMLSISTGTSLTTPTDVLDDFSFLQGWRVDQHPRMLADVDGDGQLDLVGFFHDAIYWSRLVPAAPPPPSDWDTPACAATRLQPPGPHACEGPWQYTEVQRCFGSDPSCPSACTTYSACARWENGAVASSRTTAGTQIVGPDVQSCGRSCNAGGCGPDRCTGTLTNPTAQCEAAASSRANDLRTQVSNAVMAEPSFDSASAQTQRATQAQGLVSVTPAYVNVDSNFHTTVFPGGGSSTTWLRQSGCSLSIVSAAPVTAPNDSCACQTMTPQSCEHDCAPSTKFTAPGANEPASPLISGQICLTHDTLPQGTAGEIQSKFEALWTTLQSAKQGSIPPTVSQEKFTRALVTRLKLMYELFADKLIDQHLATDEVHHAIGLYASNPGDNPACALDIDAPAVPAGCSNPAVAATHGDLIRCQRLVDPHATDAVASLAEKDCTALLNGFVGLKTQTTDDATCGGPHLRQVAARTLLKLEDKQLTVINSAPSSLGGLARQLWLLDGWYKASKAADAAGAFSDPDQQRRDTSFLIGAFWDRVRANSNADADLANLSQSTTPEQAEAALGLSAADSTGSEQGVVNALFTVPPPIMPENVTLTQPPLHSLPLLAILGDALTPLVNDLDGLAVYHDIACQFRDCRTPDTDTPSRSAWSILAGLEANTLNNTVTSNTHNLAGWKAAFGKLAAQQSMFLQAVTDAVPPGSSLAAVSAEGDVHPLARPMWLLYKHAQAFHGHYEATGLFESSAQNLLQSSILQEDQVTVVNKLRTRANTLTGTVGDYRTGLVAALQAEIGVMNSGATLATLSAQRQSKALEMDQKGQNLEGLRASEEDEEDAFASIAASFATLQGALDHGAFVQVGNTQNVTLTGRDGRYTGDNTLQQLAVQTIPNLARGQMVVVQTSGSWTPTCSLSEARFLGSNGEDSQPADLSNAVIGPEGYAVTDSDGHASAHSTGHAFGLEISAGTSVKFCADNGVTKVWGLKIEACVFAETKGTASMSSTTTNGSEARTTASFTSGLRMPSTPFPDAPVGSLLLVLADPTTSAVLDVKVVHSGGTTVVVENPSNAYLIVNDKQCATSGITNALTVSTRTMSSQTAVAQAAIGSMADVLASMRQQQHTLVDQGTLTTTQATLLRQQASVTLQANLGQIGVASLPGPLASLFDEFVSHQIVSTERKLEIQAIERSLDLDLISLRTIDDEINAGAASARLQKLVPQWLLRNLPHDTLRHSLVDLLSVSRDNLKPILQLWYPHALDNVSVGPEISALLDADVDTSLVSLAQAGTGFVNALLDAYDDATFGAKPAGQQLPVVVLTFPRPGVSPTNTFWREADATRAKRVWDAIGAHKMAHFEVTPEDFYSNNGGDAILSCTEVVPVIKSMEVYAVRPGGEASNTTLNGLGRTFHGFGGATQSFVQPEGPLVYELANAVWQNFDLPVRYGENEAAVTTFQATPRQQRPVGLSASGAFDIDFSVLDTLNQHGQFDPGDPFPVTEIQLIMEIDSRAVGTRPTWVRRCK